MRGILSKIYGKLKSILSKRQIIYNLDSPSPGSYCLGDKLRIRGWCFHPIKTIDSVIIKFGYETVFCEYPVVREDVRIAYPAAIHSRESGFQAVVDLTDIGVKDIELTFQMKNGRKFVHEIKDRIRIEYPEELEFFPGDRTAAEPVLRKVVFVKSLNDPNSMRYRVYHVVEALNRLGADCIVIDREYWKMQKFLMNCDLAVFARIEGDDGIIDMMDSFKRWNIPVVYDIDDLIFDPSAIGLIDGVEFLPPDESVRFAEKIANHRRAVLNADCVTCPSAELVREIGVLEKQAYEIPNSIDEETWLLSEQLIAERKGREGKTGAEIAIGYFSGTRTHNNDFLECAGALARVMEKYPQTVLHIVGLLDLPETFGKFGGRIVRKDLMPYRELIEYSAGMDIILAPLKMNNRFTNCKSKLKIFEAGLVEVPCVASATENYLEAVRDGIDGFLCRDTGEWFDKLARLVEDPELRAGMGRAARETISQRHRTTNLVRVIGDLYREVYRLYRRPAPVFSVVSVIYGKEKQIEYFLKSFVNQDFHQPYEIVLVDDRSPDRSVSIVEKFVKKLKAATDRYVPEIRIVRNTSNIGNCGSRNRGIEEAAGTYIVVIDADCIVNRRFLKEHYEAHTGGDCDIAIGPYNLETHHRPPFEVMAKYDLHPGLALQEADMQDKTNLTSFLNCITRNFSIRKDFFEGELFDPLFSYTKNPDSGFGWEDVEMGYRMYRQGARIRFVENAYSIHVTHPSQADERTKPLRSLKNFRRLHEKHPELHKMARYWSLDTYRKIREWAASYSLPENEDGKYLVHLFRRYEPYPFVLKKKRRLKILTFRWHCPHQYELYKLPHDFTLAVGLGTGLCEKWDYETRPLPANAEMKHIDYIDPREYDLAILHFDENVLAYENCNGIISSDWGLTFRYFANRIDLPKIAVCHGTPQFYGQYDPDYRKPDLMKPIEEERLRFTELLKNVQVVVNSHQAQREWGFAHSRVIWQGFDPAEFLPATYENGIQTLPENALKYRPHYNGYPVYRAVFEDNPYGYRPHILKVAKPGPRYRPGTNEYAGAKFRSYVERIRRYSVYFNPTLRSPMPRTRGESMLCGVVTVSMNNHDVDMFVKNGINGFYSDDPLELREVIHYLMTHPDQLRKIGMAGRETALDLFNHDRYLKQWEHLLEDVTGERD